MKSLIFLLFALDLLYFAQKLLRKAKAKVAQKLLSTIGKVLMQLPIMVIIIIIIIIIIYLIALWVSLMIF